MSKKIILIETIHREAWATVSGNLSGKTRRLFLGVKFSSVAIAFVCSAFTFTCVGRLLICIQLWQQSVLASRRAQTNR